MGTQSSDGSLTLHCQAEEAAIRRLCSQLPAPAAEPEARWRRHTQTILRGCLISGLSQYHLSVVNNCDMIPPSRPMKGCILLIPLSLHKLQSNICIQSTIHLHHPS